MSKAMSTPTDADADVERVARAIMVASNAFGEMWIDPVAIARAAIAAMPAPGRWSDADVRQAVEEATLAERDECARIADTYDNLSAGLFGRGELTAALAIGDAIRARGSEAAAPPAPASEDK
jgi:hypothetical protein